MTEHNGLHGHRPVAAGVIRAPDALVGEHVLPDRNKISETTKLSDIQEDYEFYQPGLMYSLVPWQGQDVFVDFLQQSGWARHNVLPLCFVFQRPLCVSFAFAGAENLSWDFTLHALEKAVFKDYLAWLGSVAVVDRSRKVFYRLRYNQFTIPDPRVFELSSVLPENLPQISVSVICLDTNLGCYYVRKLLNQISPPFLTVESTAHVFTDTKQMADAILSEREDIL